MTLTENQADGKPASATNTGNTVIRVVTDPAPAISSPQSIENQKWCQNGVIFILLTSDMALRWHDEGTWYQKRRQGRSCESPFS